jgi:chorismate mutase
VLELKTRGIRGANVVQENTKESIFKATREVLEKIFELNFIELEEIAAVYFTLTPDLNAAFPAEVAREMGLTSVPLLCIQEIAVPNSLPHVVRILMLINTKLKQSEINHAFLGKAQTLRDDLNQEET